MNDPRDNVVDSSFYAGIFVEAGAKPNIVSNIFHGGDSGTLKSSLTQVNTVKEIHKGEREEDKEHSLVS